MLRIHSGSEAHRHTCDLCGDTEYETIGTLDRDSQPLETVMCATCGLVSHADVPTDAELTAFYASEYREQYHGERIPSDRRVARAWHNGTRLLRQVGPLLEPGSKVFEIGAGIGCTVKQFELAGFDAHGIEPHDGFQNFSRTRLRARVSHASIADVPLDRSLDAVLLVHVIEHFGSPRDALQRIHGMLRRGGTLYVECPNLGAPFTARNRMFHRAHTFNFTQSSLTMLARSCGFQPVRVFSALRGSNLEIAFRAAELQPLVVDHANRTATHAALAAAAPLRYHLRPRYLAARVRQLGGYLGEHLTASREVEDILRTCAATPLPDTAAPRRRVA
jgi:SAM-dependent methyltransferase